MTTQVTAVRLMDADDALAKRRSMHAELGDIDELHASVSERLAIRSPTGDWTVMRCPSAVRLFLNCGKVYVSKYVWHHLDTDPAIDRLQSARHKILSMKTLIQSVAFVMCTIHAATGGAYQKPLPLEQQTPQAELWLARAFVGEAGWMQRNAHAGIAHVLARRWRRVVRRFETMRFETVIKNYCHALGFKRKGTPTRRQLWVRGLFGPTAPEAWPHHKSRWERHLPRWKAAIKRSRKWFAGRIKDPCQGRAWHWGGLVDRELARTKHLRTVECGDTGRTTFYDDGRPDDER